MIPYSTQLIDDDDIIEVVEVLKSSFITQGHKVEEFEERLCSYTGAKYAITFNSATSALFGAYKASGLTQDDEVITTPISFVATSNMLVELDVKPIWCDVKSDGNIDEDAIEALITSKTKAIVPVHFTGKPVNLKKIHAIAKKHKLLVIEDAAHAFGSAIDGKKIGSFSDMTIFSFHAIKSITTGEGGAVLTDNEEYAKRLRLIRSHGMLKRTFYDADMKEMGYNFRLTEIAAALGSSQLKKLDSFIQQRNRVALFYDEKFATQNLFTTIKLENNQTSARHLYPILLDAKLYKYKEDILQELYKQGLGVQTHYKPIYQNSFYKEKFGEFSLPHADSFFKAEISIPCHQKMSLDDAEFIADTLLNIVEKHANK